MDQKIEWWPRCAECGDIHEPLDESGNPIETARMSDREEA